MHRAAFHFIKALGVPSRVTGKRKRSQKDVGGGGDENDDEGGNGAEGDETAGVGDEEEEDTDIDISIDVDASANDVEAMAETLIVDFEPGDTLGKLLAFVNQVRMSSEDREYLVHSCCMHNIKPIELRLWVRSRWGSLAHCLSATLEVQKVCYLYIYLFPALVEY